MKAYLGKEFEIKDPGEFEATRLKKEIVISQCKHMLDVLEEMSKVGAKPTHTSIEQNHGLHFESGVLLHD